MKKRGSGREKVHIHVCTHVAFYYIDNVGVKHIILLVNPVVPQTVVACSSSVRGCTFSIWHPRYSASGPIKPGGAIG